MTFVAQVNAAPKGPVTISNCVYNVNIKEASSACASDCDEELPGGGRIQIRSDNPIAVASIHDFLRFQITEHATADSLAAP